MLSTYLWMNMAFSSARTLTIWTLGKPWRSSFAKVSFGRLVFPISTVNNWNVWWKTAQSNQSTIRFFSRFEVDFEKVPKYFGFRRVYFQIEVHPYLTQKPLIKLCRDLDITVTAYGPIGRPGLSQDPTNDPVLLDDEKIKEIAAKYGRTIPQIILRYLVYDCHSRNKYGFASMCRIPTSMAWSKGFQLLVCYRHEQKYFSCCFDT